MEAEGETSGRKPHFNINIPVADKELPVDEGMAMTILLHMLPALMQNRKRKKNSSSFARHRTNTKGSCCPGKKTFSRNVPAKTAGMERAQLPRCRAEMNGKLLLKNKMSRWMISGTLLAISDQEDEPVTSPYLDDLIHRVTSGGKTTLAREDQDVLQYFKINMVDQKVRPVVDSADAQKAMRILKKNLAMYSKLVFPGKTP